MKLMMSTEATRTYKAILRRIRECGGKVTLTVVGDAAALAEELESKHPERERVQKLRKRLGLEGAATRSGA